MNIKTACPLDCYDACSLIATVENGKVTALEGDKDHPITQGLACSRGRRIKDRAYSPHRILHPMKKVDGQWQRITWDEAISDIAQRVRNVMDTTGHHGILHAYDWGSGTVSKNLIQRFFYLLGGCTETVGSLCWDAGLEAQRYDFGQARSHSPEETANAKRIVVWGRNLSVTNMHMMSFMRRALHSGAELAVINPLTTDLDGKATLRVHPRPGSDAALALGALKVCVDEGWIDDSFLTDASVGWEEFLTTLSKYTLEFVERETDVPADIIVELARWYGVKGPVTTLLGIGMQRYRGGGNAIRSIDALAAATGQIGVRGGGVNFANRQMSEWLNQDALTAREGASVREFTRGDQAEQIMTANPKIDVMFVTRTNSVSQVPNSQTLVNAYATIGTIVTVDMFMHATAELSDYFLPCTSVLEDEDISLSTMWHPYVTYVNRAVEPMGEAKPDHEIFGLLADALGFGEQFRRPLESWFEVVLKPLESHGINLERLRREGTIRIPLVDVPWQDKAFSTPTGKYEFVSAIAAGDGQVPYPHYARYDHTETEDAVRYRYPLLTIHPRTSQNSQHKDWPNIPEHPTVYVTSVVRDETGVQEGELAVVETQQGALTAIVAIQDGGHPYTVRIESGWYKDGFGVNSLTPTRKADFGRQTAQYDVKCAIYRK